MISRAICERVLRMAVSIGADYTREVLVLC